MATYTAPEAATNVQARANIDVVGRCVTYTPSVALALNDVINMIKIPKGATILDGQLSTADLDSNGTPTIALSVGDSGSATRFLSSATTARSGGMTEFDQPGGIAYTYAADDYIQVKVSTAPATWQSGAITLKVLYTMGQ